MLLKREHFAIWKCASLRLNGGFIFSLICLWGIFDSSTQLNAADAMLCLTELADGVILPMSTSLNRAQNENDYAILQFCDCSREFYVTN